MEPGTTTSFPVEGYPVSSGPVGTVDKISLQRVVNVIRQFLSFPETSTSTRCR